MKQKIISLLVKSIEVEDRKQEKLYVLNLIEPIPLVRGSRRFKGRVLECKDVTKVYFHGDLMQISGDVRRSKEAVRVVVSALLDVTEPKYKDGELSQPSLVFLTFKPFKK